MLQIRPETMVSIALARGWVHTRGKLRGSINAAAMAEGLGVASTTITRAYEGNQQAGPLLVEKLHSVSGVSFDDLLEIVADVDGVAA